MQLSFLSDLLCCQCELLSRAAPLCQAGVRVRDARAGAAHLHLQPDHHPRPLQVQLTKCQVLRENAKLTQSISREL